MVYLASASAVKRCLGNQGGEVKLDNKNYVLNHERTKNENTKSEGIIGHLGLLMILTAHTKIERGLMNQKLVDRR